MNIPIGIIGVILLAIIALYLDSVGGKPGKPSLDEYMEMLRDSCTCKLPDETCDYCRRLGEIIRGEGELPYER